VPVLMRALSVVHTVFDIAPEYTVTAIYFFPYTILLTGFLLHILQLQ